MKISIIRQIVLILFLTLIVYSCNRSSSYSGVDAMVDQAMKSVNTVTAEQLKEKIDNGDMILLLDVREPSEFNAGYIPGSTNIPRGTLEFKIENEEFWDAEMLYMPEKEEEIIVYCKKGKRSILAAQTLEKLGFRNVKYLDDGWKHWEMTYPLFFEKNLDQIHHEDAGEIGGC